MYWIDLYETSVLNYLYHSIVSVFSEVSSVHKNNIVIMYLVPQFSTKKSVVMVSFERENETLQLHLNFFEFRFHYWDNKFSNLSRNGPKKLLKYFWNCETWKMKFEKALMKCRKTSLHRLTPFSTWYAENCEARSISGSIYIFDSKNLIEWNFDRCQIRLRFSREINVSSNGPQETEIDICIGSP